jgi:hypothetical protein
MRSAAFAPGGTTRSPSSASFFDAARTAIQPSTAAGDSPLARRSENSLLPNETDAMPLFFRSAKAAAALSAREAAAPACA